MHFRKRSEVLPSSIDELKNLLIYDRLELNKHNQDSSSIGNASNQSELGYPKIIEALNVGYGPEAYTEVKETEIKVGVEKAKRKKLVEHRSQNKNLLVPSGRKEVKNFLYP